MVKIKKIIKVILFIFLENNYFIKSGIISMKTLMDFDLQKMKNDEILYYRIHHSLEKAKMIKEKSIFLVGQIRSGKSTTYNWINDPQCLIGEGKQLKLFYSIRDQKNSQLAAMDNKFSSVTLVQNMIDILEKGEKVSLIDFPGFQENRKELQILTCSFVMKSCFTHSKGVKFLFVISNHGFLEKTGLQFINTIKNFVSFFKYKQISNEQKQRLFSSVSILITAVNLSDEQKAIDSYLEILAENLSHLKHMSKTNAQISEIIDFAEQMVSNIIKNKRLQLFKEAIVGKSPQNSRIIENLNLLRWNYFDISRIRDQYLSFPFAQNFAKMKDTEKKNVVDAILCKFSQFKQLQKALGQMIEDYLKTPLSSGFDFRTNYRQLQQIIKNNICHEDAYYNYQKLIPKKFDDQDFEQEEQQLEVEQQDGNEQQQESQYLNPQQIFKFIQQLFNLAQLCKIDTERQGEDKVRYQNYCDYLLQKFFSPTLALFSNSFAVNQRQRNIFAIIKYIFSQFIILFKILSQADKEKIESKKLELKDSILISNDFFFNEKDVIKKYVTSIVNNSNFENLTNEQLLFFVNLVKQNNKFETQRLKNSYRSIFKIHYHLGQNYIKQKEYNKSLYHSLQALFSILKHITQQKRSNEPQSNNQAQNYHLKQIEKFFIQIYHVYSTINRNQFNSDKLFNQLQNQYSTIHEIFLQYRLFKIIIDYHTKYEAENKIFHYHQMALCYQFMKKFKIAQELWENIQASKEISKKIKLRKNIKAKMQQLSKKQLIASTVQTQQDTQCFNFSNRKHIIDFLNRINKQVLKAAYIYKQEQLDMLCQQIHKSELKLKQKSQFCIDIPQKLNFFKIYKYTQHLISKINKRKVTFLIGESAGKTTAFYWIKGTPLVGAKSNHAYSLPNNYPQKSRINQNEQMPTEIPNFGLYKTDEIIIDLPVLNSKKLFNRMLYYHHLTKMIHASSEYRFLIVIKHESMKESCSQLRANIKTLIQIFKDPSLITQQIAILITFAQNDSSVETRMKLKKLLTYLKKQKCDYEQLQQRQTEKQLEIQTMMRIVQEIINKGKYTYFRKPNIEKDTSLKNNEIKILFQQRSFNYQATARLDQLNIKLFYPLVLNFEKKDNQKLLAHISLQYKQLREKTISVIGFIKKTLNNIEDSTVQIPTLSLAYTQEEQRVCLDILKQLQIALPIQYQYPYQKPNTKEGYSLNLIEQIICIYKRRQIIYQPNYYSCLYKDKVSIAFLYIKNLFKISFQNRQNTFLLNCYWLKAYEKLQQFKVIDEIIKQQSTGNDQIYHKYGAQLSDITCIINTLQSYEYLETQQLVKYFLTKFSVDRFILQSKNGFQQSTKRLLALIKQFMHQPINKQSIQSMIVMIQKLINHEHTNKNTKNIFSLLMTQIQLYSRLKTQDLYCKNNKIIKIIKTICRLSIPINLQIVKEISSSCNIIDIYCEIFDNILLMVSDSTIIKCTLIQCIEYYMKNRLFKKASDKSQTFIELQIDEGEKQRYKTIQKEARINIQSNSYNIQGQIMKEIQTFKVQNFLKLRQKIQAAFSQV